MSDSWIRDGTCALFIGDSITDCGRRDAAAPLGNGYVSMVAELATARYPAYQIRYINEGIGGNRITDLRDRWSEDALDHRPDRLSIKVGMHLTQAPL
ncbi:MAG: GDSL-type esterase/lipase family protein [Candidatus Latescibacteria bacterium]|nr:GDSL-type esterase/lipase family protein [Candidatus Latescibacterota bacterium]